VVPEWAVVEVVVAALPLVKLVEYSVRAGGMMMPMMTKHD
jgi:hypothetical protein